VLDTLLSIYAAAMGAQPEELAARRAIMERHAGNPEFRVVVARDEPEHIVAFSYGFHGAAGQWWHDVVRSAIARRAGEPATASWLSDALEIAEVHVHPDHQARGIGRRMMLALTDGRPERTALLSTRDGRSPARRLYRSLGFVDLLTAFQFPGGGPLYAVMGAPLPLPPGPPPLGPLPPGPLPPGPLPPGPLPPGPPPPGPLPPGPLPPGPLPPRPSPST
jgi:ribosomal protein S18 acetylase RimI-like enzyme